MSSQELKEKTRKELNQILADKRENLRKLRFNLASGKVKDVREIRKVRKDIARILTLLNKKDK